MNKKMAKIEPGKTYTIRDAVSTYTIIVGDLTEAPSSFADAAASNVHVGSGLPSLELGKNGSIYLDSVNKKIHVKDFSGWDDGFEMGGSGSGGANGANGRTTLEGNGPPSNPTVYAAALSEAGITSSGVQNGDLFLDTADHVFYKRVSGAWVSRSSHKGKRGRTIFEGSGDPDDPASELPSDISDAEEGDLYHDVVNFKWHRRNSSGIPGDRWDARSAYLGSIGPSGLNGSNGSNGNDGRTTIEGAGSPTNPTVYAAALADAGVEESEVKNGDLYLDTLNHVFYKRTSDAWVSRTSHKGKSGKTVFDGSGDPDDPSSELPSDIGDAVAGDLYHDVTNFKWYKRNSSGVPGDRWDPRNSYKPSELKNVSLSNSVNLAELSQTVWSANAILASAKVGDTVVDSNNKRMYKRTSAGWEDQGSIAGGKGDKGDAGDNGQNGINGKSLRFGNGAPLDSDGDDDEVYLDLSSFKVHSKSAGSWGIGLGFRGNDGQSGLNGKSVRFGNGSPSDSLGDDDEVYFDLNDFKVHTKSSGYWSGGSAFKGNDGAPGLNGKSIKFGNGSPSNTDGDDDEVYLDLSNFKVHTKATGSWNSGLAFKGSNGSNGKDGTDGTPGKDGISAQLTNDSDVIPTNSDGAGYDFSDTGGEFELRSGGSKIASGITYYTSTSGTSSSATVNGLTLSITSGGAYSLSGANWTQPFAKFTMRAIHNGVTYTKVYKVTKARGGVAGANGINGADGLPGSNGKDGTDGSNGKKVVASSAISASGSPTGATSYGCEVGDTLIDTVNHKVYTRTNSSTWTLNGSSFKGTAGESSLTGQLTKEVAVIPANSSGIVTAENLTALGGGYFKVYNGKTDVTAACTFSIPGGELSGNDYIAYIDELQLNLNKTTGQFSLSCVTWNADSTSFTMRATYSGSTVTKIYNVTKSKTGPGIKVYCVALGSDSSTSDVELTTSYKDMYLADVITNESDILTAASSKSATTFTINESGRYKIELQAAFRVKNVTKGSTYSAICSAQILKSGATPTVWSSSTSSLSATLAAYAVSSAAYASSAITISKTVFLAAGTTLKMQAKTSTTSGGTSYLELATDSEIQSAEDTILTITKL